MVTGYANAPVALSYHEFSLKEPESFQALIQPDCVEQHRIAITADSVVRANSTPSGNGTFIVPRGEPLAERARPSSFSEMNDDELAVEFSALCLDYDPVKDLLEGVEATKDLVALDILTNDIPTYSLFNGELPGPILQDEFCVQDDWDYSMFPGTGLHVYDVELTPEGAALQAPPVPNTCNGIELDPEFIFHSVEVVFLTDEKGITVPMATAYCLVKSINGIKCNRFLKCLFDTGGSVSMAHISVLPQGAQLLSTDVKTICNTIAGNYKPTGHLRAEHMIFPEFDANLSVQHHDFLVFEPKCTYDLILGNDFLTKIGLKIHLDTLELEWQGNKIPMNSKFTTERLSSAVECCMILEEDEDANDYLDTFAVAIADSAYDEMDVHQAIKENCSHLEKSQQDELRTLLFKHFKLFDGQLHTYNGPKIDIELQEGAKPVHRRAYPCPRIHLETYKKELDRLCEVGVMERVSGPTEWASPAFIVPKKADNTGERRVRFLADLRELNKVIKPRDYQLPIIQDILRQLSGFNYMTKLDLSSMFYSFELTDRAKLLTTVSTPWGLYCHRRLPMGLRNSPSHAQSAIEEVLRDIPGICAYIDDIAIWSQSWEEHLATLSEVFSRLEKAGFSINPKKCDFGVAEGDFLGHYLTKEGIQPWSKKIQAVLDLKPPTNASDVRTFVGMINWYRDFFPRRSHLLSPFTQLLRGLESKKSPVHWDDNLQKCFDEVKQVIAADALSAYPDHNKVFEIYCDASNIATGAAILQGGRPIAYYSRRLTGPQSRYTTGEKELLSIVQTLSEYRSMLFGAKIKIFTDHRNLTFNGLTSQRVLRWRCFLESFGAEWYYHPGKLNVLADAFSRLPKFDYSGPEVKRDDLPSKPTPFDPDLDPEQEVFTIFEEQFAELAGDDEFPVESFQSFMNLPSTIQNPLRYQWLAEQQAICPALQQRVEQAPDLFHRRTFGRHDTELICYSATPNDEDTLKIVLTDEAVNAAVEYFHVMLNHPGTKALSHALARFYHPQLQARITAYACDICQRTKIGQRGYGHLPPRNVQDLFPWKQVDVDLVGPWYVKTAGRNGKAYEFYALTCIDRSTGFPDGIMIKRKTSAKVADKFNEVWLSRYPRPEVVAHDQGGEFIGPSFQRLLHDAGIVSAPSTARNPQSNAVVERLHLTMGNSIRAQLADANPRTLTEAEDLMSKILQDTLHSVRTNHSEATGNTPGALAFHRDMIFNRPVTYDMDDINSRRQRRVDQDNRRANSKRYSYDYQVGGQVMRRIFDPAKLEHRWEGPYTITQVHVNGNLTIQLSESLQQRLNIRRVKPFRQPTPSTLQTIQPPQAHCIWPS